MITQSILKEYLHYDPDSGLFTWIKRTGRYDRTGQIAGSFGRGNYWFVTIKTQKYRAHRLAWLYIHGEWPEYEIDHINHIKTDNRLINIRSATRRENMSNTSLFSTNTSGFNGVSWDKAREKWEAYINTSGKKINIGYFYDIEAAIEARKAANIKYRFHKNHGT